ncbi:MAG: hypothetical protein KF878_32650 [Planctomycetes bacterium]|nr:hypothetical protein [Planctomycetota bacterium]
MSQLSCKACKKPMGFVYDVVERETAFVLWECPCGHKELERKPASQSPVSRPAVAALAAVAVGES